MQEDMTQEEINAILKGAGAGENAPEAQPDVSAAAGEQVDGITSDVSAGQQSQGNIPEAGGVTNQGQDAEPSGSSNASSEIASIGKGNIGILLDIPLNVSVELGRTRIVVKDMLQLGPGSVIELDKLIGEPVDLLVNDKLIAKGEVVVFDESFGVRITDIVNPEDRIKSLG